MLRGVRAAFRLRYSVRSLLIVVTILCLLVGWYAVRKRHADRQAAAAAQLQEGLAVVGYDYMLDATGGYTGHSDPPDTILRRYLGSDFVSSVRRVEYSAGKLPSFGLAPLNDVWGLRNLSLRGSSAGDADVKKNDLRSLRTLDVAYTDVTDPGVESLAALGQLESLDLSGTLITDKSLALLSKSPQLRELTIDDTLVSDASVQRLKASRPSLKVAWSKAPSQDHLTAIRKLSRLGARIHNVTDAQTTTDLNFFMFNVPGCCVAVVGDEYTWNSWKGTEQDLELVSQIDNVSGVYWDNQNMTDALWQVLTDHSSMKLLALDHATVTGLRQLAKLGQLQHLSLANTRIANNDLADVAALTKLESLSLRSTGVTDGALVQLRPLQQMRHIDLSRNSITDAGVAPLVELKNLETVDLTRTKVADKALEELGRHQKLKRLELQDTQITDSGLAELAALKNLEHLDISFNKVSDAGLANLRRLPRLKTLEICGTNVSDAGLEYLAEIQSLRDVWIVVDGTQVTDAGIRRLQKALPKLKITRIGD